MVCEYFGRCGSCTLYNLNYQQQKKFKINQTKEQFCFLDTVNFNFIESDTSFYRSRAEFLIWHNEDNISYAMYGKNKKDIIEINSCLKVDVKIYNIMPKLLKYISDINVLKEKLFRVEFLSTKNDLLLTLIYHKKIDDTWKSSAEKLANFLHVKVIGRSRGVKEIIGDDFVIETLHVDSLDIYYKIFDTGFVQPNTKVNEKIIEFIIDTISGAKRYDLLELYCGHGNFTIPLSFYFDKILATEVSKISIRAATENAELNGRSNIDFARLSTQELVEALDKKREFKRLKNISLDSFNFSHILVDPPRAGIDSKSLEFVKKFDNITYISCSQDTLKRDLQVLSKTHKVIKFSLFDQFPYTLHVESGVILEKI